MKGGERSEYLQLDWASFKTYETTDICLDKTVCRHILITGCKFECDGFSPAIGNHGTAAHNNIRICNNVSITDGMRYISFVDKMYSVDVYNNTLRAVKPEFSLTATAELIGARQPLGVAKPMAAIL